MFLLGEEDGSAWSELHSFFRSSLKSAVVTWGSCIVRALGKTEKVKCGNQINSMSHGELFTIFKMMVSHDSHRSRRANPTEVAEPGQEEAGEHLKGCHRREMRDHEHSGNLGSSQTWI